jgi:hypothetical protein
MGTMVAKTIIDAKGDLIAATAADTPARLAVGANDTMLVGDSTAATGLAYKSAATLYPWTNYTPSYTRLTIGNGTVVARYQQIGKTVNMFWRLVWGSTTSLTNFPVVGLPVTGAYTNDYAAGRVTFTDATGFLYVGTALVNSGTGIYTALENTSGNNNYTASPDGTTPITWTTGDTWTITATYEAA